jgi:hypothetical protein
MCMHYVRKKSQFTHQGSISYERRSLSTCIVCSSLGSLYFLFGLSPCRFFTTNRIKRLYSAAYTSLVKRTFLDWMLLQDRPVQFLIPRILQTNKSNFSFLIRFVLVNKNWGSNASAYSSFAYETVDQQILLLGYIIGPYHRRHWTSE